MKSVEAPATPDFTVWQRKNEMLWDVYNNKEIARIPHKAEYDVWTSRLTRDQIQSIKAEILRRIDGDEIATAGWIPGSDWSRTPFHPIYETVT